MTGAEHDPLLIRIDERVTSILAQLYKMNGAVSENRKCIGENSSGIANCRTSIRWIIRIGAGVVVLAGLGVAILRLVI